jgi:hypothetical protein
MYGVYRVLADGSLRYRERSVTTSKKLAEEIAADLSNGVIVRPDGSVTYIAPREHIAKEIEQ